MGNDEPKYITRLMKMQCDKGTVKNYINVGTDHGVLAGGPCDAQPVMNANDHTSKNVIHLGKCKSEQNPERAFREVLVKALLGPAGAFLTGPALDRLEELGILTYQCRPNIPQPWINVNEDCLLEGAPALTMKSQLACRYGGVISFVPTDTGAAGGDAAGKGTGEEDGDETALPKDVVNDAFNEAVASAMGEIADLGEAGEEAIEKVEIALTLASAMSEQEGWDYEKSQAAAQAAVEGGAAALYNTVLALDPDTEMTFEQAVQLMEPYGVMEDPVVGDMPFGVVSALNGLGYQTQYCLGMDTGAVSMAAAQAGAAVMMYATTAGCGCVAFHADPLMPDMGERTFTFCNGPGQAGVSMALEGFESLLADGGCAVLGAVTVTVDKPGDQAGMCGCSSCMGGD